MAKRINISIPDDLYERLQVFKDKINVSKVCQDSISDVVRKKEAFKRSVGEMPEVKEIIERLREEKKYSRHKVFELGEIVGIGWAKQADYETLVDGVLGERKYENEDTETYTKEFILDMFGDEDLNTSGILEGLQRDIPDLVITPANAVEIIAVFIEGFWKGATDFWNEIKDLI